jgi:hypothetical protein
MATKAGVWIDHKQAIVVLIADAGNAITKIPFDIGQPVRSPSRGRSQHSYTKNDFVADDKLERKAENDRKDFYDDVIAVICGASSLLILGPGETKGEFSKRITAKKVRGLNVELETAAKMTDRQIAAKVIRHFATEPTKKSGTPKKAVKKKPAKPTGRKTTKNHAVGHCRIPGRPADQITTFKRLVVV